jgi:hypothetical protein
MLELVRRLGFEVSDSKERDSIRRIVKRLQ